MTEQEKTRIRAGVQEHRHPGKFDYWHPVSRRHLRIASLHLTVRERVGGVRYIEIPKSHWDQAKFQDGTPVVIELADDPAIRVRAEVWGSERRFATIKKKQDEGGRFRVGADVVVVREVDV